jgi:SAM-dependent methyltransferase
VPVAVTNAARRGFYKLTKRSEVRDLEQRIDALSPKGRKSWYYHLDFGYGVEVRPEMRGDPHHGEENWRFIAQHLPDLRGKRILDIGANAGLYAMRMADAGASEVVGVELDTRQAEFTRDWFAKRDGCDYSNVRFVAGDARELDLAGLGHFDVACAFCVIYHLAEGADRVIGELAQIADVIALQGNLPRLTGEKYRDRSHQDLAGVTGMRAILERHGVTDIRTVEPEGHPKPLVIGRAPGGPQG